MNHDNKQYEYFDTTADIGIIAYSDNINVAFSNAALATMNILTDIEKIKQEYTKEVHIQSEDLCALLYDWITELIILIDSEQFVGSKYNITINSTYKGYKLDASIKGDSYNINKYNYKEEVKAITYHKMNIEKNDNIYELKFILDL